MGNAKLSWTPRLTKAISLDGSHYLSIDDPTLNLGTGDFCLSALLQVAAGMADAEGWIAAKGALDLALASGWHWFVDKDNLRLGLRLNDGDASPATVYSNNNSISLDSWFLADVVVDRDGQATFFVNGAAAGGGSMAAAAGTLNNSEEFKIGAYDAANRRVHGAIDFVRLRTGLVPSSWYAQEWDRVRYGYPRALGDWLEMWDFEETLNGGAAASRTLAWQGSGEPSYADGYPYAVAPLSLVFGKNFKYDYREGFIESHDSARALDGTLNVYGGPLKMRLDITVSNIGFPQKTAIEAAHLSGNPMEFSKDGDFPIDFQGYLMVPPDFRGTHYGRWEGDLEMEEA